MHGLECGISGNYPDMDMISLAQRSVVPIHLKEIYLHRKIQNFARDREYSSEIVSSCQSYFQVVTETCELSTFLIKKKALLSFCLLLKILQQPNFNNKFLLIELIDENQ
jgi:hypothetical protein